MIYTAAVFGIRPDRDRMDYYRLLVDQLISLVPDEVVVFTNCPELFPAANARACDPLTEASPYWKDDTHAIFRACFETHGPRATDAAQYENASLARMYTYKLELISRAARESPRFFWLDAGLLFSTRYGHRVPEKWAGYTPDSVRETMRKADDLLGHRGVLLSTVPLTVPWYKAWYKRKRPAFHGASLIQLEDAARAFGTEADGRAVCAPFLGVDAGWWRTREPEMLETWHRLLDMGVAATEETVLSIMRWRHALPSEPVETWLRSFYPNDPVSERAGRR